MDLSVMLQLTPKGEDELKHRTHRLSVRKRSLLLLVEHPRTLDDLFRKTVLHHEEVEGEVRSLLNDGFIAIDGKGGSSTAPSRPASVEKPPSSTGGSAGGFQLDDEIVISEAKFLLIDFCVDSFGTHSDTFCHDIHECHSVSAVAKCVGAIVAAAGKECPDRLPILVKVIAEINATAD